MKHYIIPILTALCLLTLCACTPAVEHEEDVEQEQPTIANPAEGPEEQTQPEESSQPEEVPAFAPVPAGEPVSAAWFDDAAFLGDSVSVMLSQYNDTYGVLGAADFFCSVSLSQSNALGYEAGNEHLPEYPKGSGQHPKLLDGIAASGANKIYVMLGMNCIAGGVDTACQNLVILIDEVLKVRPDAQILVESVTPMTATSPRADESLNNETIAAYNEKVQAVCSARGWYYVNAAEALSDENGYLRDDYSGDKAMGIHLNYNGAAAWADYLLTHVPEELR